jgi:hypothetical protein
MYQTIPAERDPQEFVPEESRQARRFGDALRAAGFDVLNDVVLNQVLVSFGAPEKTQATVAAIQQDGTCWCAGTVWQAAPPCASA